MPDWASLVIVVTMSTAVVLRLFAPALVAPAGAPIVQLSVRPAGMLLAIEAVILAPVWFVVTAQVLPLDVAEVGALPALAVLMTRDGVPVTPTRLIASTWNVTVWVAVCAEAEAAAARTSRPLIKKERESFFIHPPKGLSRAEGLIA